MESILSYLKYLSYRLLAGHVISSRDVAKHGQEELYHRNCNDINLPIVNNDNNNKDILSSLFLLLSCIILEVSPYLL